jgi:hypothetical protein
MSAPLAQWPGLALTLTEEQYSDLRALEQPETVGSRNAGPVAEHSMRRAS